MRATIASLRKSVVEASATERVTSRPEWLNDAYRDPGSFWSSYAADLVAAAPGASRSATFEWYDLFYEFSERHANQGRAAFREYSPASGFRDTTYASLSKRARALAASWAARGVGPGTSVCIVFEFTPAYVACMLAAWCCGASITIIPPEGGSFVRAALRAAGVDPKPKPKVPCQVFVVASAKARPWVLGLGDACQLSWTSGTEAPPVCNSFRFPAGAIAARLFSPLGPESNQLVELTAEQLYLSVLRDGVLLLQLAPGEALAAPGFSELQFKPALLLSSLACGATWTELDTAELGDGRMLVEGSVDVLGVTAMTRCLLMRSGLLRKSMIRRWFRNVAEDNDATAWAAWSCVVAPRGVVGMNYFANLAAAGSLLFSSWSQHPSGAMVWRSPGLPCELGEPNGTGMPPLADVAMLVPTKYPKTTPGIRNGLTENAVGHLVLAVGSATDVLVKNLGSHRHGIVLPEQQVEAVLKEAYRDWVRAAVLVSLPTHGQVTRDIAALLVFVDPTLPGKSAQELDKYLRAELGDERVPDRVEIFEVNPRLVDPKANPPKVDRAACRAQYISGALWGKSRCSVFRQLAALFVEVSQVRDYLAAKAQAASQ